MLHAIRRRLLASSLGLIGLGLPCPSSGFADEPPPPPKGELTEHTFDSSRIFPGTTRKYWVYVPKQYDPAQPACLHVNQDGVQYNAPEVFDALIAKKEMPITIGVFVQPGVVKAVQPNSLDRFNRSFEYDGLGDAYARFLLDELLPVVETLTTADGRKIRISKSGDDRAIAGSSSGAICAFTAAWERPDSFRRVYSAIGTYVGLRGGDHYPTLIRKYEPKPIRIFLQDGSGDLNHWGGDWWTANQAMERALAFAGYEVEHAWGDGGHNNKHATAVFPDAVRWLWKDWPRPVQTGSGSAQLQEILVPGEGWMLASEGHAFTDSPAVNAKGEVFFIDVPAREIHKIDLDGKVGRFVLDPKEVNGLAFGPDGRLYTVSRGSKQVLAYDSNGKAETIADGVRGDDLTVLSNGRLYATSPADRGDGVGTVWLVGPDRRKRPVDSGLIFYKGATCSPDQSLLYVADGRSRWVYSYQIQPDGSLAHKQRYYHLHTPDRADSSGADGMAVDAGGRLYVATHMGIQVCDQPGRVIAVIPAPNGRVSDLCFGGPNFDVLYAMCRDQVYKRKVKTHGVRADAAPIKPPTPRL